jgi:CBS domain-containing protein
MKLSEIFAREVVTAAPEDTVATVAHLMQNHNVGTVVLVEGEKPVGIITDRDVAISLGAQGISPEAEAESIMTSYIRTIPDDTGLFTLTQCMKEYEVRRLPIVDSEGHLVGLVSFDDLLPILGRELYNLAEGMERGLEVK